MAASPTFRLFARGRQLTGAEWALLAEAFIWLVVASAAIRALPFLRVGQLASAPLSRASPEGRDILTDKVRWAVEALARRVPWKAVCFQQGLAAQIMLRRRGVASTLYFGAAPDDVRGLAAHVWVRDGLRDVIGCENAGGFAVLAKFPPNDRSTD